MYSVYHQETLVPAAVSVTSLTVIGASAPTPFEILTPTILLPPIPACGDLHGIPRKGRGCHVLAFVTALDRCGLAGEETAFLVFQAVVVPGLIIAFSRFTSPLAATVI